MLAGVKVWINAEDRLAEQAAQRQNEAAAQRLNEHRGRLHNQFFAYRGWNRTDLEQALGLELRDVAETEYQRIGRRFFVDLSRGAVRVAAVVDEPLAVYLVFHKDQLYQVSVEPTRWLPMAQSKWRKMWLVSELLREGPTIALSMLMWAVPLLVIIDAVRRTRVVGHAMIASGIIVILGVQLGYQPRMAGIYMTVSGICQIVSGAAILWWPVHWWARRGPVEPLCEKCGYNLTGNVSGRCPECGGFIPSRLRRRIGIIESGKVP
jgi:hypothetical protein